MWDYSILMVILCYMQWHISRNLLINSCTLPSPSHGNYCTLALYISIFKWEDWKQSLPLQQQKWKNKKANSVVLSKTLKWDNSISVILNFLTGQPFGVKIIKSPWGENNWVLPNWALNYPNVQANTTVGFSGHTMPWQKWHTNVFSTYFEIILLLQLSKIQCGRVLILFFLSKTSSAPLTAWFICTAELFLAHQTSHCFFTCLYSLQKPLQTIESLLESHSSQYVFCLNKNTQSWLLFWEQASLSLSSCPDIIAHLFQSVLIQSTMWEEIKWPSRRELLRMELRTDFSAFYKFKRDYLYRVIKWWSNMEALRSSVRVSSQNLLNQMIIIFSPMCDLMWLLSEILYQLFLSQLQNYFL